MNINADGIEIEDANSLEVLGEWIKFVDAEGVTVKIPPELVKRLMVFALDNVTAFDEGAWG